MELFIQIKNFFSKMINFKYLKGKICIVINSWGTIKEIVSTTYIIFSLKIIIKKILYFYGKSPELNTFFLLLNIITLIVYSNKYT